MSISAWRALVCAGLVTQLAFADETHPARRSRLPDYRWVVEKQEILVRPQDIGESKDLYPEGLTRLANGDWLLAACCAPAGKTVILRSSDGGRTWKRQGVFEHRIPEGFAGRFGLVEGMVALRSGRAESGGSHAEPSHRQRGSNTDRKVPRHPRADPRDAARFDRGRRRARTDRPGR